MQCRHAAALSSSCTVIESSLATREKRARSRRNAARMLRSFAQAPDMLDVGRSTKTLGTCDESVHDILAGGAGSAALADTHAQSFTTMPSLDHDCELFRAILGAWLDLGLRPPCVNATLAPVAIGYCIGSVAVLEAVRGRLNLSGVVSFQGLLQTGVDGVRTIMRIENGPNDPCVLADDRERFFAEMNAAGVDWRLIRLRPHTPWLRAGAHARVAGRAGRDLQPPFHHGHALPPA